MGLRQVNTLISKGLINHNNLLLNILRLVDLQMLRSSLFHSVIVVIVMILNLAQNKFSL